MCLLISADCPPNTFTCKDGTCIPEDWVGDGEPDCDDRSDETGAAVHRHHTEDPFDEIITQSPTTSRPEVIETDKKENEQTEEENIPLTSESLDSTSGSTVDSTVDSTFESPSEITESRTSSSAATTSEHDSACPYEHQIRIDECSEPILLFLHEINDIYFENSSFLANKEMQSKVEKGCSLMEEYNICIQGASPACQPDAGVLAWRDVEVYACQLVLPTAREYESCFGVGRDTQCYVRFDETASPFCRLVSSIAQDVECIQKFSSKCSQDALEMLPPVLEESEHITSSIRCPAVPATDTPVATVPPVPVIDEDEARSTPTASTTQTVGTTKSKELSINMADAVNSLYYIYDICSSDYSKSPFKPVAAKICEMQDEIAKHSDCFQATLEKEKCNIREVKSECEALEAFNSNLDCAIVTMNDACEVNSQNMVIDLQEKINDVIIEHKCFNEQEKSEKSSETTVDDGEFHLKSSLPRCADEQENSALACLVELIEINKQLSQFQNLNFLLEVATPNSTVVANICEQYTRYETCLQANVFKNSKRCSFSSPLNTLARIGLSPICALDSRPLLAKHRSCLQELSAKSNQNTNCQSGLSNLGNSVNMMLQGIHGEALLCKSFYLIRDTFSCGEMAVEKTCDAQALMDLRKLKTDMTTLGEEEGCPTEIPANLDEIIARPVKRPDPIVPIVPKARPLASSTNPPMPPPPPRAAPAPACSPDQQKKFESCVKPLTAFQPHPLSVIKMPRQIDEACAAFAEFKECSSEVPCHPLWAKGMTAMFEYACGEGAEEYKEIRQCLRKTSQGPIVSTCVGNFSRGAPTQACLSANKLLSCSISTIQTECGESASKWITSYVTKFATAIDNRCKLASQLPVGKIVGVGCSAEEEAIIEHCGAPLNDIGSRMEELFQGGLQSMIKNINGLAPVFAGGCNLTDEFRTCASFLLAGRSPCVVSSCMIQAGNGICDQPDPAKAIDENLSCVFGQIQEPTFAKCIRTTISTVKQFTLTSFRNVLPKFVDCTEEIVKEKCGETPINVLRAMSSPDLCPIAASPIVPLSVSRPTPIKVEPKLPVCTEEKRASYEECTRPFYSKYRMLPTVLINEVDNMDQICEEVLKMDGCSVSTRVCASPEQLALKKMMQKVCSTKSAFDQYKVCLKAVATSPLGASCMSEYISSPPATRCDSLTNAAKCMAKDVMSKCGEAALEYSYNAMADFAKSSDGTCMISTPTVDLLTGCSEDDVVEFLDCEASLDIYSFRPISIIADGNQLESFCQAFNTKYRPCIDKMKCKFEPVSSTNVMLMDSICNKPVTKKDQTQYGKCLSDYTNSVTGRKCIEKIGAVDPLSKEATVDMCPVLNDILNCASEELEEKCGYDALLHVYGLHIQWAQSYNSTCVITSPQSKDDPSNILEESRDATPQVVIKDDTTPASTSMDTERPTTTHPKDITTTLTSTTTTTTTEPIKESSCISVVNVLLVAVFTRYIL
ncbi:unnamed protein product [Auanema sp. JU1783]|nr:unnamed protein product [Auanema sp. JU1783]